MRGELGCVGGASVSRGRGGEGGEGGDGGERTDEVEVRG